MVFDIRPLVACNNSDLRYPDSIYSVDVGWVITPSRERHIFASWRPTGICSVIKPSRYIRSRRAIRIHHIHLRVALSRTSKNYPLRSRRERGPDLPDARVVCEIRLVAIRIQHTDLIIAVVYTNSDDTGTCGRRRRERLWCNR